MSILKKIATDIKLLDEGIAGCLTNKAKIPTFIRSCQDEIDRARETEKDKEKRDNIIKAHQEQIDEHNRNDFQNDVTEENYREIKDRLISTHFSGVIGRIKLFFLSF